MKQYEKYKDSGIAWIGEVPKNWNCKRMKFCIDKSFAGVWGDDARGDENDVRCYRVADFRYDKLILSNNNSTNRNVDKNTFGQREVKFHDILLEKSGGGDKTPVGRAVYVNYNYKAICSNFVHCIKVDKHTSSKFLLYVFSCMYSKKVNMLYFSQTTGIQNLNVSDYLNNTIYYPPIREQQAIAEFLDGKCLEIDELVSLQEQMIKELQAYKQSVITEAVTKGLDPNAPLKDSGISWIGEIPEHWNVKRIKYIFNNLNNLRCPISSENRERKNPKYDYYGASGIIDRIDNYNVADKVLLIGEDGANLITRNLPLIYKAEGKFWVNNHAHILKPKYDNYNYLAHLLESADFYIYITGSAQPKLNQEKLSGISFCIPPIAEQQAIADHLDKKCNEIDQLIDIKKEKIVELKEYKKSVIFEYVTGKKKVN